MFQQVLFAILVSAKVIRLSAGSLACPVTLTNSCNCTQAPQVLISCKNLANSEQLRRILATVTSQHVHNLTVSDSTITQLDSSVLAGKSFTLIRFFNVTPLKLLVPESHMNSFQTLTQLSIENHNSSEIQLPGLAGMQSLSHVEVIGGFSGISHFPALSNLRILHVYGNRFSEFPRLPFLRRLQILNSCCGSLNSLGQLNMSMFPVLKKIYLFSNKIAALDQGSFHGVSPYLELIDLSDNEIHHISPTTFKVTGPNLHVKILRNYIDQLDKDIFQPLTERFSKGKGQLHVQGNPLRCDCSVTWLVRNTALRKAVAEFTCIDYRTFSMLTVTMYKSCP